jgi:hypothetical protein
MSHFGRPRRATITGLALALAGCSPAWTTPSLVETRDPMDQSIGYQGPRIAMGMEVGMSAGMWRMGSGGRLVRATRFTPGLPATTLVSEPGVNSAHAVAVADDGSAIALVALPAGLSWSRHPGTSGATWGPLTPLGEPGRRPGIAGDGRGNMLAVWVADGVVRGARYSVDAGTWGAAVAIGTGEAGPSAIDVSMNTRGDGIAAWCVARADGSRAIAVNRHTSLAWAGEEILAAVPDCLTRRTEFDTPSPHTADTAMADTGVPTVIYANGGARVQRYERRGSSPAAWQPVETVWTPPIAGHRVTHVRVAVNQDGDAMAAWYTEDGGAVPSDVFAVHYSAEFRSYGAVTNLAPLARPRTASLGVGIARDRRGMVVYQRGESTIEARAFNGASFLGTATLAPGGAYEFDFAMHRAGVGVLLYAYANRDIMQAMYRP